MCCFKVDEIEDNDYDNLNKYVKQKNYFKYYKLRQTIPNYFTFY
jgi:hypothetical protein